MIPDEIDLLDGVLYEYDWWVSVVAAELLLKCLLEEICYSWGVEV